MNNLMGNVMLLQQFGIWVPKGNRKREKKCVWWDVYRYMFKLLICLKHAAITVILLLSKSLGCSTYCINFAMFSKLKLIKTVWMGVSHWTSEWSCNQHQCWLVLRSSVSCLRTLRHLADCRGRILWSDDDRSNTWATAVPCSQRAQGFVTFILFSFLLIYNYLFQKQH